MYIVKLVKTIQQSRLYNSMVKEGIKEGKLSDSDPISYWNQCQIIDNKYLLYRYYKVRTEFLVNTSIRKSLPKNKNDAVLIGCGRIVFNKHSGYISNLFIKNEYRCDGSGIDFSAWLKHKMATLIYEFHWETRFDAIRSYIKKNNSRWAMSILQHHKGSYVDDKYDDSVYMILIQPNDAKNIHQCIGVHLGSFLEE